MAVGAAGKEPAMAETYTGEVRNGVVVFEGASSALPEGTKVRIEPIEVKGAPPDLSSLSKALLSAAGTAKGLPPDLAENHDHYLHGTPIEVTGPTNAIEENRPEPRTLAERYAAITGIIEGLPPDFAAEHDHYIHGAPRRDEA
jgi:hypothetical protein